MAKQKATAKRTGTCFKLCSCCFCLHLMLVLQGHRQQVPATDLHRLEDRLVQYACMVGVAIAFCWGAYDNLSATQAAKGTALALQQLEAKCAIDVLEAGACSLMVTGLDV
jgi:hypothetical protein